MDHAQPILAVTDPNTTPRALLVPLRGVFCTWKGRQMARVSRIVVGHSARVTYNYQSAEARAEVEYLIEEGDDPQAVYARAEKITRVLARRDAIASLAEITAKKT